jgi:hypothetical protein
LLAYEIVLEVEKNVSLAPISTMIYQNDTPTKYASKSLNDYKRGTNHLLIHFGKNEI